MIHSFRKSTNFSNGNSTATCTSPAAAAAMVRAQAETPVVIAGHLLTTGVSAWARTIAAAAAGLVQAAVLFPLEKFVLFRKE